MYVDTNMPKWCLLTSAIFTMTAGTDSKFIPLQCYEVHWQPIQNVSNSLQHNAETSGEDSPIAC